VRGSIVSQLRSRTQWGCVEQGEGIWLWGVRDDLQLNSVRSEGWLHKVRGVGNLIVVSKYFLKLQVKIGS